MCNETNNRVTYRFKGMESHPVQAGWHFWASLNWRSIGGSSWSYLGPTCPLPSLWRPRAMEQASCQAVSMPRLPWSESLDKASVCVGSRHFVCKALCSNLSHHCRMLLQETWVVWSSHCVLQDTCPVPWAFGFSFWDLFFHWEVIKNCMYYYIVIKVNTIQAGWVFSFW